MKLEIITSGRCRPLGFRSSFPARYLVWHGEVGSLAIDTGYGAQPSSFSWPEWVYAHVFRVHYARPLPAFARILITHHHLDHIGGLGAQACIGPSAPPVGGSIWQLKHATFARALAVQQTLLPPWTHERFGFPAVVWHDLEVLSLPGHTANHAGVYFPALHLLYVTDAVWFLDWFKQPAPPRWATALQEEPAVFLATFQRLRTALGADPTLRVRCAHDPAQPEYEVISF